MKRILSLIIVICIALTLLSGCAHKSEQGGFTVVTTVFAAYDWVRELTEGLDIDVILLNTSSDLHSYEPSATDMVKLSSCDMIVYVGGSSDSWVTDVISQADKDITVINMMDTLSIAEHGHDGHEHGEDEHVWLSLRYAKVICNEIAKGLSDKFPDVTEKLGGYENKLDALDSEYAKAVKDGKKSTLIFADRFPFCYLLEDYGIEHIAAFSGCTSESDASFKTIVSLADATDRLEADFLLQTEGANGQIAKAVQDTCLRENVGVLTLHSMQSETDDGKSYIQYMTDNLEALRLALK